MGDSGRNPTSRGNGATRRRGHGRGRGRKPEAEAPGHENPALVGGDAQKSNGEISRPKNNERKKEGGRPMAAVRGPQRRGRGTDMRGKSLIPGKPPKKRDFISGKATTLSTGQIEEFLENAIHGVATSAESRQSVVNNLATEDGLLTIRQIVETDFSPSYSVLKPMFDPHCIMFFCLVSNDDIMSSLVLEKAVGTVYNVIHGHDGRRGVAFFTNVTSHLLRMKDQVENSNNTGQEEVLKFEEALLLTTKTLLGNLTLNQAAGIMPEFREIVKKLCSFYSPEDIDRGSASRSIRLIHENLLKIKDILSIGDSILVSKGTNVPQQKTIPEPLVDLPGELSEFGPRHDNDHALISDIRILPTINEIISAERDDFLPVRNTLNSPSQHHQTGILRLLDSQFRLLREDTSGVIRDAVRLILENWATLVHNPDWRVKRRILRDASPTPARIYLGAMIQQVKSNLNKSVDIEIEFDQLSKLKNQPAAKRKQWWREFRALKEGGPLLALIDGEDEENPNVIFLLVSKRETNPSYQEGRDASLTGRRVRDLVSDGHRAMITARPTSLTYEVDMSNLLSLTGQRDPSRPLILVEFPAVLYKSFEGVLRCLQTLHKNPTSIPFTTWLAPYAQANLSNQVPTTIYTEGNIIVPSPAYLQNRALDLSCIPKSNNDTNDTFPPLAISVSDDPHSLSTHLSEVTTLDHGQAVAMVSALKHEVALIQGPPGTGKSFVGIQLARVLLSNRDLLGLGPILCVCYTNHALDQFLHELLDSGVSNIARIGSPSTSARLEELSLDNHKKRIPKPRIRGLGKIIAECRARRDSISAMIEQICNRVQGNPIGVMAWFLKKRFPVQADKILGGATEEMEYDLLMDWFSGDAPGDWNSNGSDRSIDQLLSVDVWTLTKLERTRLFQYWNDSAFKELSQEFKTLLQVHSSVMQQLTALHHESDAVLLDQFHIIGVTTVGLANNSDMLRGLRAKVMICEEAGEVLESHVLIALLPSIQHAIFIGDHLQLRPRISNLKLSMEYGRSGPKYNLDESLFERLANSNFGNMLANSGEGDELPRCRFPIAQLDHQRRMHPLISTLVRDTLYPHLRDHPDTTTYPAIAGMKRRLFWLDHRNTEDPSDPAEPMQSKTNTWEASMVTAMVRHLCRQGRYKPGEIAVLTPYVGQLRLLRDMLGEIVDLIIGEEDLEALDDSERDNTSDKKERWPRQRDQQSPVQKGKLLDELRIATVDNFQGEEATVVIISLVRSNKYQNCGFLKTPNRINVLLSRARHGMYIIGDANTASPVPMWSSVIQILEKEANIGRKLELQCSRHPNNKVYVSSPDDFAIHAPEGGCAEKCRLRLSCGHSCSVKCHSTTLHRALKCMELCTRIRGCGHLCSRKCHEPCGDCLEKIPDVVLPCGHKAEVECQHLVNLTNVKCEQPVTRIAPGCGHSITMRCHEHIDRVKCSQPCNSLLPCGHNCRKPCWKCTNIQNGSVRNNHGSCDTPCGRSYTTCSHICDQPCHPDTFCSPCKRPCEVRCKHSRCPKKCNEPCPPCAEPCGWSCDHREDHCHMPCAVPCDIIPCNRRCEKKLDTCGHRCPGVCGESCPDSKFCQLCCKPDILQRDVDLITFEKYGEVDLDADPLMFLSCGHFYTVSSLDGIMELTTHYITDPTSGNIVRPRLSNRIVTSGTTMKGCPECRMPVRDVDRYNRIVKKALLDEATRRFVAQANSKCAHLLEEIQRCEIQIQEERSRFILEWSKALGESRNAEQVKDSLEAYKAKGANLQKRINKYVKAVSKTEQPFGRVNSIFAAAVARQRDIAPNAFEYDESAIQTGFELRGQSLSLRLSWAISWDHDAISGNDTVDSRVRTALVDGIANRINGLLTKCVSLVESSKNARFPQQELEGRIHHALFSMLLLTNLKARGQAVDATLETSTRQKALHNLKECEELCSRHSGTSFLKDDIEKAKRLVNGGTFYDFVTTEEKRDVYRAMAQQFSGTGHWYYCRNHHPFTVGDCGMPMEQARCPQCGAPVGGQNHTNAEGVTRAADMDAQFGHF